MHKLIEFYFATGNDHKVQEAKELSRSTALESARWQMFRNLKFNILI